MNRSGNWKRVRAASFAALMATGSGAAAAQPASLALVIGNGAYAASPTLAPLPDCGPAARGVAAALRSAGFTVTERHDVGRGELDAAVAAFARALREAPGAAGVAYFCGHLANQGPRLFLLPVSATLQRESDLLTQGVLARLTLDALLRAQPRSGLVVLEGGTPAQAEAMAPLTQAAAAGGVGFVASQAAPGPLGTALAAGLRAPRVALADLLAGLRRDLPQGSLAALGEPAAPSDLVGAPPPVQAAAPPPPIVAPTPPAPAQATPAPPAAAPSAPLLVEERALTEADRRRVQGALARMGYYAGLADGTFGPNTRAAIRRFQFELGAELTGTLTPEQAGRLLSLR